MAIVVAWTWAGWAAAPLTTLRAISELSNDQARQKLPVAFEATVTYFRGYQYQLFVQDGDLATYVSAGPKYKLFPGDRVLIKGTTQESFHAIVVSDQVTVLRHGAMPKPVTVRYGDLILGQRDCALVKMRGVVHSADLTFNPGVNITTTRIQMLTDGGYIEATIDSDKIDALNALMDAEVEVTGVAGGVFDDKMEQTRILLHLSSLANIRILKRASKNVWDLPVTPMNRILGGYRVLDETPRIRVQGTVTYYQPGSEAILQSGGNSVRILTWTDLPLRLGYLADATGFADVAVTDSFLGITHGEVKDTGIRAPIAPLLATWQQLAVSDNRGIGHHFDLVSIEGEVVTEAREGGQDTYILVADGHPFSAVFRHPSGSNVADMRHIPPGTRVRVTGICILHDSNPWAGAVAFDILLRSYDDIAVIKKPTLLNVRNLVVMVGLLLAMVALAGAWGWVQERRVRQKTAALARSVEAEAAQERRSAQLEQQRSRILEDINGARPLAEILEQIVKMVSSALDGAPIWCETADGTRIGEALPYPNSLRVVRVKIDARSGPALGTFIAAFDAETPPSERETGALLNGARLATLAIETRRLYSDLRRRSEFDLLTEIPNRFAMDKRLDALMEQDHENGCIFGLIYIDLDKLKPINDRYGHHVGDIYLQQVALRMKRQLRSGDLLARLGGDEFAALVSAVRSRSDVEEVARRLEGCFEVPFVIEGYLLRGEASFGVALYPADGSTKDNLLNAADAAMYAVKNGKKRIEIEVAYNQQQEVAVGNRK